MPTMTQEEYIRYIARTGVVQQETEQTKADPRESVLHAYILAECRRLGWIAFHGSMAHRTHRTIGEPDFIILAEGGRVILIEAKGRATKVTKEQQALHAWVRKLGHEVYVLRNMKGFNLVVGNAAREENT